MGEVLTAMVGRSHVACRVSESAERLGRLWRVIIRRLARLHARLDRIEIMRVRRQHLQGGAALPDEEAHLRGPVRLQVVEKHDVAARRSRDARRRWTDSMKVTVFGARHLELSTTQPHRRTAPTNVKLSPQFIGRGFTYSSPRLNPHVRVAHRQIGPASSTKIGRLKP